MPPSSPARLCARWPLAAGSPADRVFHVPNALPEAPRPAAAEETQALRAGLGLGSEVVLLYTRFVEFPPRWPLQFARALRCLRPDAQLVVLGEGLGGEHVDLAGSAATEGMADAVKVAGWPGQGQFRRT